MASILGPEEDPIEMELRHIREGEERVVRQEAIVSYFDAIGNAERAAISRELLVTFREFMEIAHWRLNELRRHARTGDNT